MAKSGANRSGRAAAVRSFLATQTEALSARQILDAVEPGGDINLMTATLGTLFRNKAVEKHGAGLGNVRWRTLPGTARERPAARATDSTVHAVKRRTHAPKPKRESPTIVQEKRPLRVEQKPNFPSLVVSRKPRAKAATAAGYESVEEFQRRGGRIQILRLGECSQPLQYDHSQYADHRAKGRATQKRNRADKGA